MAGVSVGTRCPWGVEGAEEASRRPSVDEPSADRKRDSGGGRPCSQRSRHWPGTQQRSSKDFGKKILEPSGLMSVEQKSLTSDFSSPTRT